MEKWLDAIVRLTAQGTPAVLVTVAAADGSAPREPGAKMLVTADSAFDTIGGGHLELRACEIAREILASRQQQRIERFALGPSLGQCCGGIVQLAFERTDAAAHRFYARIAERTRQRRESWRLVALEADLPPALTEDDGDGAAGALPPALAGFDRTRLCHMFTDVQGRLWLADPCRARCPELLLFGAGHVGAAIVRALAELPCHVTWIDEREELFPADVPANVTVEATDIPEAMIAAAPAGASYLVLTHSHALDQRLAEAILRRGDSGWFGLIGSKTKRAQFERRLRARGIPPPSLARMACPIGIAGISGKAPAVIAASVCAQLLQAWEAAQRHTAAAERAF